MLSADRCGLIREDHHGECHRNCEGLNHRIQRQGLEQGEGHVGCDAVYDEKGTNRRIQGAGAIVEAWQGWGKAIPDSKATFVREFASGDTAVFEIVWKGVSHRTVADTDRHHSGIEQADRGTGMPSRPGRGR